MIRIVEITTPTCGQCKMIKPMLELAMKSFDPAKVVLDVLDGTTDEEAKALVDKHNVTAVPFFVFQKDGEEMETHSGVINIAVFKNKINSYLQ